MIEGESLRPRLHAKIRVNLCYQGVNQHLHPPVERHEQTVTRPTRTCFLRTTLPQHREYQAAILLFHVEEARQRGAQTQRLRIRSVNTTDHRLGHTRERL